jgi:hypothetical protein
MGWNDHIMGPGYEHLREDEDMAELITVREACRKRTPLDGTDAKALEHALAITEAALAAANAHAEEAERKLCAASEAINAHLDGHRRYVETVIKGLPPDCVCPSCKRFRAALSSSSPCRHEAEADAIRRKVAKPEKVVEWSKKLVESIRRCDRDGNPQIDVWALSQLRAALHGLKEGCAPSAPPAPQVANNISGE